MNIEAQYTFTFDLKWISAFPEMKAKIIVNYDIDATLNSEGDLETEIKINCFNVEIGGVSINEGMLLKETHGDLLVFLVKQTKGMDLKSFGIDSEEIIAQIVEDSAQAEYEQTQMGPL